MSSKIVQSRIEKEESCLGRFFSIILAVFLWFNTHTQAINPEIFPRGSMIAISMGLLVLFLLGHMFSWLPMQKAEQHSAPRILEMFHKDKRVIGISWWLIFFALATFVFANDLTPVIFHHPLFFPVWIIMLGALLMQYLVFLNEC